MVASIASKLNAIVLLKVRTHKFGKYPVIATGLGEYTELFEKARDEGKKLVVVARFSDGWYVADKIVTQGMRDVDKETVVLLDIRAFKQFL